MVEQNNIKVESDGSYVDWAAIFAGSVISAGVVVVFTTFAAGLGLGSITADDGGDISTTWLIITALFAVISMVASYMLGGYITGRMSRPVGNATRDETTIRDGLNGLAVWGIGILISGFFAASALTGGVKAVSNVAQSTLEATGSAVGGTAQGIGQLGGGMISGTGNAIAGAVQGAGQALAPSLNEMLPQSLKNNPFDYITDSLFRKSAVTQEAAGSQNGNVDIVTRQVTGILGNLLRTGEISDSDRSWIVSEVSVQTNLNQTEAQTRVYQSIERIQKLRAEAEKKVEEAQKQFDELKASAEKTVADAKEKAVEVAEKARVASILTAFLLAAAALVAAAAAYIGAIHGGRHRDEGRIWGGLAYRK
ncbi:hypothetical protein [Pseudochrobactrum asaccharolyticum]|uniref:Uncharacterized protein n=1 Tax=Pseudochrobactrum asaccharolyticum TaxID=354351 RepID=A0A366DAW9_9HYPH|nr:hypothetical protein [Pseudochrobactrum asaccharolyticum]MBX8800721.1 hypothetical protein [Ochrobactrum sp. MR28]MBX8818113.1 hypothetical protein [Ochrobactrum sp. MR31]RBO87190.1 hypothetical protein DFR47_1312 [Pseudochrobactrum asaccharolyticum]